MIDVLASGMYHNDLYVYTLQNDHHSKSISITTQLQYFFLVMQTFKISLSNFKIYNGIL